MNAVLPRDRAVRDAYKHCVRTAQSHYENFPVASRLLPARLRDPIAAIYAFARTADDYADEGARDPATRLALLDGYARRLDGPPGDDPVFIALADARARYDLPASLFHDLLHAFRMDVTRTRYADFSELAEYCRYSANPIGRLLLHLYGRADRHGDLLRSDAICTALQLLNFLQDISQDFVENDRIYLPQDEMARCGVDETHVAERRTDAAMLELMALQTARIHSLLATGAPLAWTLPGRMGLELRMTVFGATRILEAISNEQRDVFRRPRLGARDWIFILRRGLTTRRPPSRLTVRDLQDASRTGNR